MWSAFVGGNSPANHNQSDRRPKTSWSIRAPTLDAILGWHFHSMRADCLARYLLPMLPTFATLTMLGGGYILGDPRGYSHIPTRISLPPRD